MAKFGPSPHHGNVTHGHSSSYGRSPTYRAWYNALQRCNNPNDRSWIDYGGRGITICERWLKFENFLEDMGVRPSSQLSLSRTNNDGNYKAGNCKWATWSEQNLNRRPFGTGRRSLKKVGQ